MQVSSTHQMYVFLLFVIMGILCGMIFDTQRFFRKKIFAGAIRTTIEDIVFAILSIGIMIGASFILNNGEMRYYQYMGAISGMLFYVAFLSRIFQKIISVCCVVAEKIFIAPVVKILTFFMKIIKKITHIFKRRFSRIKRKVDSIKRQAKKRGKIIKKRIKML